LILPGAAVIVIELDMDKIELKAGKRQVLGKKVRFLRRQGITPANVFGRGIDSTAVQINTADLKHTIGRAGKTSLISLKVEGEKTPRMVILRDIHCYPLDGELLHADLYQVSMAEKIRLEIPLSFVGEAPAVKDLDGILLHELSSVEVECLPGDMPHRIEVDISALKEIDQAIHVSDLKIPRGVSLLTDPEKAVVLVTGRRIEAEEEKVAVEEAEAEAEAEKAAEERRPEAAREAAE